MSSSSSAAANTPQNISRAKAWVLACRPATLSAGAIPVLVGSAIALNANRFAWKPALAALAGSLLLQIGSNLANDVYDYEKGADTETRLGPMRTVQSGLLTPQAVKRAMWLVFGLALAVGIYLTAVAGPVIVGIGLAAIASAILYTAGPYPLGYHGLGDIFVLIFFGFVAVTGTVFVQAKAILPEALVASVPVGSLATAILVVNNVRDRHTDAEVGKRTLAVRFGRRAGVAEYALLLTAAYVVPPLLVLRGFGLTTLAPLLTLPWAVRLFREVEQREGASLNETLVGTAKLLAVFGLLFTVGIAVAARAQ